MIPFANNSGSSGHVFPLYLAPMAGITDSIFRRICKEQGADVMVTEFVSAEGILHRNERTARYVEFHEEERPVGVQLFGAEPARLAEAARAVVDWVQPDFIDLNFGCPVSKVVCKNGGSALLKDCPLLEKVATAVVKAAAPLPVTGKIRIGWDSRTINAVEVARLLEGCGVQVLAVHGRTRAQGYSGEADWDTIARVADAVTISVIGNGDITTAADVMHRRNTTRVSGVMIGRAAMAYPWVFAEAKHFLQTGELLPAPSMEERWELILRHCRLAVAERGAAVGDHRVMHSMRGRLMAYTKGMLGGKHLRQKLQHISTITEVEDIAAGYLSPDQDQQEAAAAAA